MKTTTTIKYGVSRSRGHCPMHWAYEGFHCPACCVAIMDYKTLTWERPECARRQGAGARGGTA